MVLDMSQQGDQRNGSEEHLENQEANVTMEKYLSPGQHVKKKKNTDGMKAEQLYTSESDVDYPIKLHGSS